MLCGCGWRFAGKGMTVMAVPIEFYRKDLTKNQKDLTKGKKNLTKDQKDRTKDGKDLKKDEKDLTKDPKDLTKDPKDLMNDLTKEEKDVTNYLKDPNSSECGSVSGCATLLLFPPSEFVAKKLFAALGDPRPRVPLGVEPAMYVIFPRLFPECSLNVP
jgi:hypothetical protein